MLKIVGIMLLGVFTGYLLKNYQLRWVQKWIMLAIWLLLFLLGIAVGTNGEIMNNLIRSVWKVWSWPWEEYREVWSWLGWYIAFSWGETSPLFPEYFPKSLFWFRINERKFDLLLLFVAGVILARWDVLPQELLPAGFLVCMFYTGWCSWWV